MGERVDKKLQKGGEEEKCVDSLSLSTPNHSEPTTCNVRIIPGCDVTWNILEVEDSRGLSKRWS